MAYQGRKKRIAISQRYDQVPGRNEWRDGLDVRWAELIESLGAIPILLPSHLNDVGGFLASLSIDGLLLSGGNDIGSAAPRDKTEAAALAYADQKNLPVLGVCRGMQFMCHTEGGTLERCKGHVATYHSLASEWVDERQIVEPVNSYHELGIYKHRCPSEFNVLVSTEDGVVEAFSHQHKHWFGIMWHPERETPFKASDLALITKHFELAQD
jgi:putative glutamine amidotransferase